MVATHGETTGMCGLRRMQYNMLQNPTGRRILREHPIINSDAIDLNLIRQLPQNTLGQLYVQFLDGHEVTLIEDEEIAYIMLRYRQANDFWHALTGLGISVEAELGLKWFEFAQAGLPVALLSGIVGPLRLFSDERTRLSVCSNTTFRGLCSAPQTVFNLYVRRTFDRRHQRRPQNVGYIPPPQI
ncbi:coenzyme Q biosynthesis protein Coq4-domain-containing protein [Cladochytrium replicatum]|nr:coenzyme Q biosynthesis protein Coq4-domain-containing protein [Cladochytrium replicatum]